MQSTNSKYGSPYLAVCHVTFTFTICISGSDTFVEVGMPRSPSHSANASELKQMLASCTMSSRKRQTVELLQRTKNSLLQYVIIK